VHDQVSLHLKSAQYLFPRFHRAGALSEMRKPRAQSGQQTVRHETQLSHEDVNSINISPLGYMIEQFEAPSP